MKGDKIMKFGDMTVRQIQSYCQTTGCSDCRLNKPGRVCAHYMFTEDELNTEFIDKTRWQIHDYNDGLFICPNCGYEIDADLPCSYGWAGCPKCLTKLTF